jgi:hypothetical protein
MLFRIRLQSNAVAGLRRSVWLLAAAFGLSTCGSGHEADCLKSNGAPTTQRRPIDRRVRSVVVYDNVDLIIVPDTATYAEVTAGEHVIDQLTFTYRNPQTLLLNNTSRCNFVRSYDTPREVRLHTPRLTNLEQRGYGTISTASRWAQDTLFVHLVGGTGFLFASGLQARFCYFKTTRTSLGDAHVRATQNLGGTLDGKGTFYYAGMPSFIDVKGNGKLVKE